MDNLLFALVAAIDAMLWNTASPMAVKTSSRIAYRQMIVRLRSCKVGNHRLELIFPCQSAGC
ncbi:hypothetical protein OI450_03405 [Pectobacterium cacticida]|uniref:Uncharacterized protein n=1 Tax=Pectobacterium cacticida TaxID=69221 RepID=A0ABZ2GB00_9GAMM|nr:hypothetical protein [Pectobacterium cacticida]UYX07473.1 hypothetical protein OI450_03405 [Pectobacterium cacticida]